VRTFSKGEFVALLMEVKRQGWIRTRRPGNAGAVGNTLEDILGIAENNLSISNTAEWELKVQRRNTNSLLTLFHFEPSPRAARLVPQFLLPYYGWPHDKAGKKHPPDERSFRQTLDVRKHTDRGFKLVVDSAHETLRLSFDAAKVDPRHETWKKSVQQRVGLEELDPQPYWNIKELIHHAGIKLHNMFYVIADSRGRGEYEEFNYSDMIMLMNFEGERFLESLLRGDIQVDFDARTGHNHGTKFRLNSKLIPSLYRDVRKVE